ncbi:MAG: hypothetical protein R3A45_05650 [Bdellovibrionota bacterium]
MRLIIKETKNIKRRSKSLGKLKFRQLQQRVQQWVSRESLDHGRLEMEVALLVEKSDVTEELVFGQSSQLFSRDFT